MPPLVEPLACSIHAVQRAQIQLGDVVVIAGAGTLGLGMVGVAKLLNPSLLISIDPKDYRLEVAKTLGADMTMNPDKEDAVARVQELTDGYGCDVYIDATGYPSVGAARPADAPQAGHVRGVRRLPRAGDHRLDDHRRQEGAERPRARTWRRTRSRWRSTTSPAAWWTSRRSSPTSCRSRSTRPPSTWSTTRRYRSRCC